MDRGEGDNGEIRGEPISKAKAEKGTGVDGWNDYLLKKASRGVKVKYYEVLKEMMVTKEFPEEWKEWTATFAMKPGEDPRELGRRRNLWCTCAGQKLVARMLGALYEEQAEHTGYRPVREGSRREWEG